MNQEMKAIPVSTLNPEALRSAMRAWTAGVTVVTAALGGQRHGMTVNSFTSVSLDPAWITISLRQATRTHQIVMQARSFGVTILSTQQKEISQRFSGHSTSGTLGGADRFEGLETATLVTGSPLIKGGLAWLDCRVVRAIEAGENTLFLADVVAAQGEFEGEPLIYHHRAYWHLDPIQDG
jgi:flavin reductase (DIM6/NTAB) family NADH-FMN oxidoreductase RutF